MRLLLATRFQKSKYSNKEKFQASVRIRRQCKREKTVHILTALRRTYEGVNAYRRVYLRSDNFFVDRTKITQHTHPGNFSYVKSCSDVHVVYVSSRSTECEICRVPGAAVKLNFTRPVLS